MRPILVVDDERPIANLIRLTLEGAGYACRLAYDGQTAADLLEEGSYALALLDIMLPQLDGYDLLGYAQSCRVPVIFLTAKAALQDRVKGLHCGADDYIVKPFEPEELVARVEAVLRRSGQGGGILRAWDVELDTQARTVTQNGMPVELRPREFDLLAALLRSRGMALYRDYLYDTVWGGEPEDTRTLDIHIQRLRKKLGWQKKIATVYKVGYRLEGEP